MVLKHAFLRETEIREHCVPVRIQDYVIGFEVTEDDVAFVEVLESQNQLGEVEFNSLLRETLLSLQMLTQITSRAEVQDKKQLVNSLERET
jgi:hypothetical protein